MITRARCSRAVAGIAVILLLAVRPAHADELRVMTSGAFTAAYLVLVHQFEQATGHHLLTEATSMGVGPTSIEARLAGGEAIDVVIVADAALEGFIRDGRIVPGSRVDLARSAIGMAVRKGSPRPDISSVDALRQTLLAAGSVAYSASVSGTYLSTELFQQLGIADEMRPKSRRIDFERVGDVVARGEAEIGFQQISELLPVAGIDLVGPLPAAVQRVTVFSAGVGAGARHPDTANAFIRFLASPAATAAIEQSGLDPVVNTSATSAGPRQVRERGPRPPSIDDRRGRVLDQVTGPAHQEDGAAAGARRPGRKDEGNSVNAGLLTRGD